MAYKNYSRFATYCILSALSLLAAFLFLVYSLGSSTNDADQIRSHIVSNSNTIKPTQKIAEEFKAHGYYYFRHKQPSGFEDIAYFWIKTRELQLEPGQKRKWQMVSPGGYVQTSRRIDFEMVDVNGNQIDFQTVEVDGARFSFDGCIIEEKYLSLFPKTDKRWIVGTLRKKKGAMVLAETTFGLGWYGDLLCSL